MRLSLDQDGGRPATAAARPGGGPDDGCGPPQAAGGPRPGGTAPAPGTPDRAAAADGGWAWGRRDTPIGPLLLVATAAGLRQVVFHADDRTTGRTLARLRAAEGEARAGDDDLASAHLEQAAAELAAYLDGGLRRFTVPLDWSLTCGFTGRVLRELAAHVPYGTVVGYQHLADRVGEPGAARAVGAAMGANPLPVVVPCHRVVASDGGIGGFGGGLETKRRLLALEGVLPDPLF
ncbi:methylated-DNA--[protein]-cysteine S-methyltransferase [Streptomyces sp. NPDC059740]|uniref:methylated-DNA--[protein]-cysteine S-methyltransferase n=1 Tax=Streptomyces sp. NPDC059740 TaxID=3346926 RepID=UPI0036673EF3